MSCGCVAETLSNDCTGLICCDKKMVVLKENTEEASTEKHIPIVEKDGNKVIVSVGSVEHPMDDNHWIEWIEIFTKNKVYRKHLNPGDKPMAEFFIESELESVRAYCNLHGLWRSNI